MKLCLKYSRLFFFPDTVYSASQKKSPPRNLLTFSPNSWEFLVQILHAYYTFLSMLDYKFLFNYLQLWPKLYHIKHDHHNVLKMYTVDRNARWVVALNMA